MADIQLGNGRDDGHRADGIEREAVAGVTFEAEVAGEGRRLADTLQAGAHPFAVGSLQVGIAVGAGVQLDDRRSELRGGLQLQGVRLDEERSEEHTSELQSLLRNSYAVFYLKKKNTNP